MSHASLADSDWTRNPDGRSNSSERFLFLVREVERLIRGSAHSIVNGDLESVAVLIMAQLAHMHGLRPTEKSLAELEGL